MAKDEAIEMLRTVSDSGRALPSLSICIATYRRAGFIQETLVSILNQLPPETEVVVVDGASPDETAEVVGDLARSNPALRYIREATNSGIDADYDKAIGYATGDYCWLMTDDDLLAPGAVRAVLETLHDRPGLVIVNTEVLDATMAAQLESPRFKAESDLEFESSASEDFFRRFAHYLTFIGAVIVHRATWLSRDRVTYYGSLFVHVGVIFQEPPIDRIKFLAQPLVRIRYGNAMWSPRSFDVWTFKWPDLVWSFRSYSRAAKRAVCAQKPWRRPAHLLLHRALGTFGLPQYQQIARLGDPLHERLVPLLFLLWPRWLANLIAVTLLTVCRANAQVGLYDLLRSPHASAASRLVARLPTLVSPRT